MIIRRCDCCHKELDANGYFGLEIKWHSPLIKITDPPDMNYDLCADCTAIVQGVIRKNLSREGKGYDY